MFFAKDRIKTVLALALPIVGAMISQNILNLIDTAMVGRLGAEALAAVGISSIAAFLIQAPVIGISSAVQAMAARKKGEGKEDETAYSLNAAFILILVFGTIITFLSVYLAPALFGLLTNDVTVKELAIDYFNIRMYATIFVAANYSFRGFWNALGLPKIYLKTLIIMHSVNVLLNYCFIFGNLGFPRLEVSGAALGTSISILLGTVIYLYIGIAKFSNTGLLKLCPSKSMLLQISKIAIPSGADQMIIMTSVLAFYWIVGKIGTTEVAAANILINIFLVTLLPALALGMTLSTLSGQALGRGDENDAVCWGKDVLNLGVIFILCLSLPMFFFSKNIMHVFTSDVSVIKVSVLPLQVMGITLAFEVAGIMMAQAMRGLGYTRVIMISSFVFQWIIFFPIACILILVLNLELIHLWIWQAAYRLVQTVFLIYLWYKGGWKNVKLS